MKHHWLADVHEVEVGLEVTSAARFLMILSSYVVSPQHG